MLFTLACSQNGIDFELGFHLCMFSVQSFALFFFFSIRSKIRSSVTICTLSNLLFNVQDCSTKCTNLFGVILNYSLRRKTLSAGTKPAAFGSAASPDPRH